MVTVKLTPIEGAIREEILKAGVPITGSTYLYTAMDKDELLGWCVYTLGNEMSVELLKTVPEGDEWMMDGLIRASVNHAFSLGVLTCSFSSRVDRDMLKKFYFDQNATDFRIEIDDLLTNHKNCKH